MRLVRDKQIFFNVDYLICFGFRSLFKILLNNFWKTIVYLPPCFLYFAWVFWNVYFWINEKKFSFRLCFDENIKHKVEYSPARYDSCSYHFSLKKKQAFQRDIKTLNWNSFREWKVKFSLFQVSEGTKKLIQQSIKFMLFR